MIRQCRDYLVDIIDAIEKVESFTKGMTFETFENRSAHD